MVGAVKTVLLYTTSILCGIILIFSLNGTTEIFNHFPKNPWFNIFSDGIFEDLASGFSTVLGVLSTQTYFQSIMAGKNPKTSKISSFFSSFFNISSRHCMYIYRNVHENSFSKHKSK